MDQAAGLRITCVGWMLCSGPARWTRSGSGAASNGVRGLGLGDDPAATFLDRGRVALSPGGDFGRQGHGFARLNMGTSPELLAEAVRRMAAATGYGRSAG
jgi:hypothetical protein